MSELKKVVVTGATSGIGLALVEALLASDRQILAIGRNQDVLARLSTNGVVQTLQADVRELETILPEIEAFCPDVLINNAGIGHGIDGLDGISDSRIQEAMDVNVSAPIKITAAVVTGMKKRSKGHIINIGSIAGLHTLYSALYGATKSAIHLFSQNLRAELSGTSIRVTEICPGRVSTGFFQAADGDKERLQALGQSGINELMPEDIARTVLFALDSPAHMNISTIEVLPTDQAVGGMKMNKT